MTASTDAFALLLSCGLFALAWGFVRACDRW